jgi:tetratricopeptide (TPR) repeat protein
MSPEQFARKLNRQAALMRLPARVDPKTPYKWLRGALPRPPWPAIASIILSEQLGVPVTPTHIGWPDIDNGTEFVSAASGLEIPWTAAGAVHAAVEVAETNIMDRRIFLQLAGAALTQPALDWLIADPAGHVDSAIGRRVYPQHVDGIDEMTSNLRRMDDQFGGGAVLDLVKSNLRFVIDLLQNHRYDTAVGTRLHGAAAELLRLGGWLSFDAGQHAQAQRYWLAALRSAHTAGDRSLGANILGFMSCQAKDLELYAESARLAEAARRGYDGASPRVAAILALRVAEARAQTGEGTDVQAAIDQAYSALRDTPPEAGEPAWSYWLDEAQVNAQAGYCYTKLSDWPRAQSHLLAALRLQEDSYSREGALRRALLATTYARQGDPEQACEIGNRAIDILADDVDSDRCVGHVRRLQLSLSGYKKVAAVRELNERVDATFGAAS